MLYYEERLRDKLLRFLVNKGRVKQSECAHLFKSADEYLLIGYWLHNKGMVEMSLLGEDIKIIRYGEFFIKNESFLLNRIKKDAVVVLGIIIGLLTLYFAILSYKEAKKINNKQSQMQSELIRGETYQ